MLFRSSVPHVAMYLQKADLVPQLQSKPDCRLPCASGYPWCWDWNCGSWGELETVGETSREKRRGLSQLLGVKPGSAKWAEGRSREESEEEPFQEGGKQGHKAGGSAGEKETHEVRG